MSVVILESHIKEIKQIVKKNASINIDHYVTSFLQRRIKVRMISSEIEQISKYVSFLDEDPLEALELNASLSINVTEFFRNQNPWDVFEQKVIPEISKSSNISDVISIWSAGCAVGNEAYSLAMMLSNALGKKQFMITATDINPTSIGIAETGQYEYSLLKNISKLYLLKFLEKIDDNLYRFNDDLKKNISFQVGDITSHNINPVDVIVCRNLIIYYGDNAKDLIFKKFHKTLKDDGFLFLGMAETLPFPMKKFFVPVELGSKIYRKITPV